MKNATVKNADLKIKGVSDLLAAMGYEAASKDVNEGNLLRYAKFLLTRMEGNIVRVNVETRVRTESKDARHLYEETLKAFKAMGLV